MDKPAWQSWHDIRSTHLKRVRYNIKTKLLQILFQRSPTVYQYEEVPIHTWQILISTEQPGEYFSNHIKPKFLFIKLTDAATVNSAQKG